MNPLSALRVWGITESSHLDSVIPFGGCDFLDSIA